MSTAPRPEPLPLHGYINIDKPTGMTSFDVVRAVRRAASIKRVGHAGTLDPLATGVLPVAIGSEATRLIDTLVDFDKAYLADIAFGVETDTDDAEGQPVAEGDPARLAALTHDEVAAALVPFEGHQLQFPPAYSAIKRDGVPAYRAARRGEPLALDARAVVADSLRLVAFEAGHATVEVECGKGYYVRSLARDLGRALGVGGHIAALRRTRVGPFAVTTATPLLDATARLVARERLETLVHAPDAILVRWPAILLTAEEASAINDGKTVSPPELRGTPEFGLKARVYGLEGRLLALAEHRQDRAWHPYRVFPAHTEAE